jgi:acyl-CoA dehydrogenase
MAQEYSLRATDELPYELLPFKARFTPRFFEVRKQLLDFIREDVIPAKEEWHRQRQELESKVAHATMAPMPAKHWELMELAKKRGLFNFFLPEVCGLSCVEYTTIQEILGTVMEANLAMNCMAPDTGNMEVLEKYGNTAQKKAWLEPLLEGRIRSAFAMTEPGVASSDATNISTTIRADGDQYVINGHKWYISGAIRPECKIFILLGRTSNSGPVHKRFSMILVPRDAPGVEILRPLGVFGHLHDHAEIIFKDVRVPKGNLLLEEGRGFEIAQGRLGPGRLHHCMRTIGQAETGLQALVYRAKRRDAFGQRLIDKQQILERIAEFRMELTAARQLCYLAAVVADDHGWQKARTYVSMIKVKAPRVALQILDEAIQVHGAHGLSQDSKLSDEWIHVRHVRFADGPDAVHLQTIAKEEIKREPSVMAVEISGTNHNIEKYGMFPGSKL